ncbi:hypothetical protein CHS0354_028450 [Potamilus streckersoni]|uniref:Ig-like domain-containing protein n=1 Tax=Potamilus streckersoni TaxID=2493646 RepID=A0AAE0SCI1_9BIVA|nr:hypothetical protein CHS0354_028450 [Potamilus streckersoni]
MSVQKYNNLVQRGEDVTLICYVPSNLWSSNCLWYFIRNEVVERLLNGTKYTVSCSPTNNDQFRVPMKLLLKNATFNDSGKYICIDTESTVRGEMLLNVHAKPQITVPKTNYKAVVGTNVTLECMVNANGDTNISTRWENMFNTQWKNVTNSNKYYWTTQMPSLVISEVMTTDSGSYRCFATNPLFTSRGLEISLQVQNKPTVTVNEYNYTIRTGENLTVHCSIDGHDSTVERVEWLKQENSQYRYLQSSTRVFWDISSPSLKIINVSFDDAGNYTCRGMTEVGAGQSQQIIVQVFYLPVINQQDIKDLNVSSLNKYVVPGVSVVACLALIALIVVVKLIRTKLLKDRADKPNSGIRRTNQQRQPSPSGNISSGDTYEQLCFHQSEHLTYTQLIRQSNTYINESNITEDDDTSPAYMNINNICTAVQQNSSTSN